MGRCCDESASIEDIYKGWQHTRNSIQHTLGRDGAMNGGSKHAQNSAPPSVHTQHLICSIYNTSIYIIKSLSLSSSQTAAADQSNLLLLLL